MQVIEGIWHMREQCVPGSLSSSPAQEPGNEARYPWVTVLNIGKHVIDSEGSAMYVWLFGILALVN